MDSKVFVTQIKRLHGLQAVDVTFNKGLDSISSLRRLRTLGAKVSEQELPTLLAIINSNDWENDRNRRFTFWDLGLLNENILQVTARDIESIKTGSHWASGLMTGRMKRQKEVTQQLIDDVLNENIIDEVSSWGASIEGHFAEIEGLPAIEFAIRNRATCETLVVVAVDGWSGRYSIDGVWGDRRFSDTQSVRERIYSALTDSLDHATVA